MEIVELCSAAQRREALPILRELYPSLDEDRYTRLLEEMVVDGYRQFAVRHEAGELVAVAGAAVHVNLYYGRHLYIYDLVVTEGVRSEGYGELLMDHVEGIARCEGCETAALACDLEREGRFASTRAGAIRSPVMRCARRCVERAALEFCEESLGMPRARLIAERRL